MSVAAEGLPKDSTAFWASIGQQVKSSERIAQQFDAQLKFFASYFSPESGPSLDGVMKGFSHYKGFLSEHAAGFEDLGDQMQLLAGLRHKHEDSMHRAVKTIMGSFISTVFFLITFRIRIPCDTGVGF
jgi:hypothetical protein